MVARAGVLVDTVLHAHGPFAFGQVLRDHGAQPALALELAFAFGDDHLEAFLLRGHGFAIGPGHRADIVVVDRTQPLHAEARQRVLDGTVRVHGAGAGRDRAR